MTAFLYNVSTINLIGANVTCLKVEGAEYVVQGNTLIIQGKSAVVTYKTTLPKGVIGTQQPENLTINVLIPVGSSITYLYPQPTSFTVVGDLYNISFENVSKVTVLYTYHQTNLNASSASIPPIFFILAIALSDASIFLFFLYYLRRSKKAKEEEIKEEVVQTSLDERDKVVLEALKKNGGASTLSELVKQTNLPKTTVYRRVKRLITMGYVEEVRERGKVKYVLRKEY